MRGGILAALVIPSRSFLLSPRKSLGLTFGLTSAEASVGRRTLGSVCNMVTDSPFGTWTSPITSKAITAGSVGIGSLHIDPSSGDLLWIEGRPQEGGRYVICKYDPDARISSERGAVDVSPKESNVRTRVHEYGGGAVTFGGKGSKEIYYSEFATQRLMKLVQDSPDGSEPTPVTPDGNRFRFADGVWEPSTLRLMMVREDHLEPHPKDVVNQIVAVSVDGSESMEVLATGNDFYAAPRPSPDGTKLAYITWNHPNMPWDATELRVTQLADAGAFTDETDKHDLIAGEDGDTSIIQPLWHPQTSDLYYISDQSGYWNIYRNGTSASILPLNFDFGGRAPGWQLGQQGYGFLPDGKIYATYTKDGETKLIVASVADSDGPATNIEEYGTEHGLPPQFGGIVPSASGDTLYFIGGSSSIPTSVYSWSLSQCGPAIQLASSSSLKFSDNVISVPRQVEFPTTDSEGKAKTAFGYYYPPQNKAYQCTMEKAPPLLVKAHGGPTACTSTSFNPAIQFWTSRGFAVLDVDYGGSTGYGREYRRRLRNSWGIVDIDDVCAGAQYLVKEGLADPERLCIDGGSAGGYTTLGALTFKDVFTAGCSLYGIGDLTALAGDTHKFESRYLDGLIGKDEAIYKDRSPIEHVDSLSCPVLLLQGDEDKIVPPNQAEMMFSTLKNKGIPSCIRLYKGEQHGFRKAENIEDALDSELAFFGRVYGIDVPDAVQLDIVNL